MARGTRQPSLLGHRFLLNATMDKISAVARHSRRNREKLWRGEHTSVAHAAPLLEGSTGPDPVRIAVLAMERLGRASLRASITGAEVRVAAPDNATAEVFRAALAETAQIRSTDRLIRVVVE
jgi:hypothetical protein